MPGSPLVTGQISVGRSARGKKVNGMLIKYCPKCGSDVAEKLIDGAARIVCRAKNCNFVHWDNPVPVVAVLVKHGDGYIVARNAQWPQGIYSVITGYLEQGETPDICALREVQEELGLDGKITHFIGYYLFKEKNQLILAFEVEARGEIVINDELAEIKILSPAQLRCNDFSPLYITQSIITDWAHLDATAEGGKPAQT